MLDALLKLDTEIFLFLNSLHCGYLDNFVYIFSGKLLWLPTVLMLIYIIFKTQGKKGVWILLIIVVSILIADQISSSILKPLIARLRPSRSPDIAHLVHTVNGYIGGRFSFTSSHAANSFVFATITTLLFRNRTLSITVFVWAMLNSYSRIYLGVHYPLDIICGTIIGISSALFVYSITKKYKNDVLLINKISNKYIYLFVGTMLLSTTIALVFRDYLVFLGK